VELDALYLRALECYARACLGVACTELAAAEHAGRELIALAPYRDNGYRLLMQALARTGNTTKACVPSSRASLGSLPAPRRSSSTPNSFTAPRRHA
jgi:hypothetical protein